MKILFGVYPWAFDCPGGGERQLLAYKNHLENLGVKVDLYNQWSPNVQDYDIFHFFSVMPGSFQLCQYIKEQGLKLIISPNLWVTEDTKYNYPHDEIKRLLAIADKIIVNSKLEAQSLSRVYEINISVFNVVYNGVEERFFKSISPTQFLKQYRLDGKPYILNVANVEERKNQKLFLRALKKFPYLTLVTIGHARDKEYLFECKKIGEQQFQFIGSLTYNSDLLRSAYIGCEFFVMPSTLETPSIAALEAAASGKSIIITQEGSTKEYFQNYAQYINPNDISSMEIAIDNLVNQKLQFSKHIKENFLWQEVTKDLKKVYEDSLKEEQ